MSYDLQGQLESEVIDKLLSVMKSGDRALAEQMAGLGTRVGSVTAWADRPTVDQNGKAVTTGDTFVLTQASDGHPAGVYSRKPDNSDWTDEPDLNYDDLNINQIIANAKAADDAIGVDNAGVITAIVNDKFATPKQVGDALSALNAVNTGKFHPKNGDAAEKIIGADADENTKELVNASQLQVSFTQADIQAKYDAL